MIKNKKLKLTEFSLVHYPSPGCNQYSQPEVNTSKSSAKTSK